MKRYTGEFAQKLLDEATAEWDGDVSPSGIPSLTGYVVDPSDPSGKRHVVLAEFQGENGMRDLALASNAAGLARRVVTLQGERDTLLEALAEVLEAKDALEKYDEDDTPRHVLTYVEGRGKHTGRLSDAWKAVGKAIKMIKENGG